MTAQPLRYLVLVLFSLPILAALSGCSILDHPILDTRTTSGVLARYEKSKDPKPVVKFLFRHGRDTPDQKELVQVAEWSIDKRIMFIRLLDKLENEYKETFITEFPKAVAASSSKDAFLAEYGQSIAPSVARIVSQIKSK